MFPDYNLRDLEVLPIAKATVDKFVASFDGITNAECIGLLCWALAMAYRHHYGKELTRVEFIDGVAKTIQASIDQSDTQFFGGDGGGQC